MAEREHNLPSMFSRLDDQITGPVLDAVVIRPRSHGRLYLPGEWGTSSRPPRHEVKVTSSDPDNQGVCTGQRPLGSAERCTVSYDVGTTATAPPSTRSS